MTADDAARYVTRAGEGSRHVIFPGVEIRTTAGQSMTLSVVRFEAGAAVNEHAHPHEQVGILLSGRLEFTIGGVTRVLEVGDRWTIPGGVPHSARALDGPAEALDVFHPIREDYL